MGPRADEHPGVGAYEVSRGGVGGRGTSAAFKSRQRRFRDLEEEAARRSEGGLMYDISHYRAVGAGSAHTARSAFESRSDRRLHGGADDTPGPGSYPQEVGTLHSTTVRSQSRESAAFRSRTVQRTAWTEGDSPGAGAYDPGGGAISGRGTTAAFVSRERRFRERDDEGSQVGPGAYSVETHGAIGHGECRASSPPVLRRAPAHACAAAASHAACSLPGACGCEAQRPLVAHAHSRPPSLPSASAAASDRTRDQGTASFRSRSGREHGYDSDTPGPGAYDSGRATAAIRDGRGTTSPFRSRQTRSGDLQGEGSGLMYDISWYRAVGAGSPHNARSAFNSQTERTDFAYDDVSHSP